MNEDDNVVSLGDDAEVFDFNEQFNRTTVPGGDAARYAARSTGSAFAVLGKALAHLALQTALFMLSVGVLTVLVAIPVKFVLERI